MKMHPEIEKYWRDQGFWFEIETLIVCGQPIRFIDYTGVRNSIKKSVSTYDMEKKCFRYYLGNNIYNESDAIKWLKLKVFI